MYACVSDGHSLRRANAPVSRTLARLHVPATRFEDVAEREQKGRTRRVGAARISARLVPVPILLRGRAAGVVADVLAERNERADEAGLGAPRQLARHARANVAEVGVLEVGEADRLRHRFDRGASVPAERGSDADRGRGRGRGDGRCGAGVVEGRRSCAT